jgi:hypothetical protein
MFAGRPAMTHWSCSSPRTTGPRHPGTRSAPDPSGARPRVPSKVKRMTVFEKMSWLVFVLVVWLALVFALWLGSPKLW